MKLSGAKFSAFALLIITFVFVYQFFNLKWWQKHPVIHSDVVAYYGYIPSILVEQDVHLTFTEDENYPHRHKIWFEEVPGGSRVFKVTYGAALGYLPFVTPLIIYYEMTGTGYTGFELSFRIALLLSGMCYTILGLVLLNGFLKKYAGEMARALLLLLVTFGSNLYYYATIESPLPHALSFLLVVIFLWLTRLWYEKPGMLRSLLLGLTFGWIILIRPVNAMVFLLFLGYEIASWQDFRQRLSFYRAHFLQGLLVACMIFVPLLPQLWYWKITTGQWFFYSYTGERFFWGDPKILEGLLSPRKGWLFYTPLMVLSLAGIFLIPSRTKLRLSIGIFTLVALYVTFSWWCWWYGGGFSQRAFVDFTGIFAIPMLYCIQQILDRIKGSSFTSGGKIPVRRRKTTAIAALVIIILLGGFNILQTIKYRYMSIHYDSMTFQAYTLNFWKVKPDKDLPYYLSEPDYAAALKNEEHYRWE